MQMQSFSAAVHAMQNPPSSVSGQSNQGVFSSQQQHGQQQYYAVQPQQGSVPQPQSRQHDAAQTQPDSVAQQQSHAPATQQEHVQQQYYGAYPQQGPVAQSHSPPLASQQQHNQQYYAPAQPQQGPVGQARSPTHAAQQHQHSQQQYHAVQPQQGPVPPAQTPQQEVQQYHGSQPQQGPVAQAYSPGPASQKQDSQHQYHAAHPEQGPVAQARSPAPASQQQHSQQEYYAAHPQQGSVPPAHSPQQEVQQQNHGAQPQQGPFTQTRDQQPGGQQYYAALPQQGAVPQAQSPATGQQQYFPPQSQQSSVPQTPPTPVPQHHGGVQPLQPASMSNGAPVVVAQHVHDNAQQRQHAAALTQNWGAAQPQQAAGPSSNPAHPQQSPSATLSASSTSNKMSMYSLSQSQYARLCTYKQFAALPIVTTAHGWAREGAANILRELNPIPRGPNAPADNYAHIILVGELSDAKNFVGSTGAWNAKYGALEKAKYSFLLVCPHDDPVFQEAWVRSIQHLKILEAGTCGGNSEHFFVMENGQLCVRFTTPIFRKKGEAPPQTDTWRWPVGSAHADKLKEVAKTHDARFLPFFDENDKLIPMHEVERLFPGCLVEVHFRMVYFTFRRGDRMVDSMTGDCVQICMLHRGRSKPTTPFVGTTVHRPTPSVDAMGNLIPPPLQLMQNTPPAALLPPAPVFQQSSGGWTQPYQQLSLTSPPSGAVHTIGYPALLPAPGNTQSGDASGLVTPLQNPAQFGAHLQPELSPYGSHSFVFAHPSPGAPTPRFPFAAPHGVGGEPPHTPPRSASVQGATRFMFKNPSTPPTAEAPPRANNVGGHQPAQAQSFTFVPSEAQGRPMPAQQAAPARGSNHNADQAVYGHGVPTTSSTDNSPFVGAYPSQPVASATVTEQQPLAAVPQALEPSPFAPAYQPETTPTSGSDYVPLTASRPGSRAAKTPLFLASTPSPLAQSVFVPPPDQQQFGNVRTLNDARAPTPAEDLFAGEESRGAAVPEDWEYVSPSQLTGYQDGTEDPVPRGGYYPDVGEAELEDPADAYKRRRLAGKRRASFADDDDDIVRNVRRAPRVDSDDDSNSLGESV